MIPEPTPVRGPVSHHHHRWAPGGKFRLLIWQRAPEEKEWVEDHDTLPDAKTRALALGTPDACTVAVYDHLGRSRFHAPVPEARPSMRTPESVTKLAGFDEPKPKAGSYSYRRK